MKKYNVAIVGIRSAVGQEMLTVLQERHFPINELRPMSTHPEDCPPYHFQGRSVRAVKLDHNAFQGIHIGLFSPGAAVSKVYVPSAVKADVVVIDNTSQFRMDPDVPLVVPEVNAHDIKKHKGIIANPNCATIQMVVALKPLHDYSKIKRIVVSTYQSVSGAGSEGLVELRNQTQDTSYKPKKFQHPIAFNLIPQIDVPLENLYTKEEMKMVQETQKIMGDNSIRVTATCVRVPVFRGHCESVNIETEKKITRLKAMELLKDAPGVKVIDDLPLHQYPMPIMAAGKDETFVGRIREDSSLENGLNLWIVSDNLRKGAATNAVQIAEYLIKNA